ncbi:3-carboxymuconate cyclase [Gaeumannomyces tritici R3-111a-1]|uniref:3-carboxymuconate cyclase n=1 Tax=Gaeumannomyces tritici (strain R3-111a-1) TaxID=644352 RepID=J3NNB8_GAET3|nr:3-carboxymuconate cyclase [Gaeumannomyces tritici R3-111a-1]EJT77670.1 3-carboxymuconate cyclase [Gaeumannomyces tritici R3-111a-1]
MSNATKSASRPAVLGIDRGCCSADVRMDAERGGLKREPRLLKTLDSAAPARPLLLLLLLRIHALLACLFLLLLLLVLPRRVILDAGQDLYVSIAATLHSTTTTTDDMLPASTSTLAAAGVLALSAAQPAVAASSLLYASSYGGSVTTLGLTAAGLDVLSSTRDCSPDPAWLTLDRANSVLYCTGEGLATRNGSLAAFRTSGTGSLELLHKVDTIGGPVSSVLFGDGGRGLAVAHYTGSSLSSFSVSDLGQLQSRTWGEPLGPNTTRQDAPHPHEATVDPTGKFVLVPDLGSDLVRVMRVDPSNLGLTETSPLVAAPGSGPRHLVFLNTDDGKTFMYLVGELDNSITAYRVKYAACSLGFDKVFVTNSFGDRAVPQSTAAEIHLSPDSRFLLVSSRSDKSFTIPSFDGSAASIPSDTISSFTVDPATGALALAQTFPAGGLIPRQFSINKAGDRLAVGLQADGRVVIIERDVRTGILQRFVGSASLDVGVTTVLFDE